MSEKYGRREFLRKSAGLGMSAALGHGLLSTVSEAATTSAAPEICVVTGGDYLKSTIKAVEMLGGLRTCVPKGSKVALLPNVQSRHPGTFTGPDVLRGVIRMCKEAGAAEVNCLSGLTQKHWEDCGLLAVVKDEGAVLKLVAQEEAAFAAVPIPLGKALMEARVMKELWAHDVFINLPVTKDHVGTRFTGTLKNLMGLNSRTNNRSFHKENWKTDPGDIGFLEQCIADLNTVIRPALCVVDATEFIITNGPMGPGELSRPKKVVAGRDRVAIDAYCASLWGLKPAEVGVLKMAVEHGLGRMDLTGVKISETTITS
jgi:uncharacterized protein (DUF362 family)